MFLADRTRRHDPHLEWKVGLFSVAAVCAVVGMVLEERWMVSVAIVLLAGGVVMRVVLGRMGRDGEAEIDDDEDDDEDEDEDEDEDVDVDAGEGEDGEDPKLANDGDVGADPANDTTRDAMA